MSKKAIRILVAVAASFALMLSLLSPAGAEHRESHDPPGQSDGGGGGGGGDNGNVCEGTHVYPTDDLVADEGKVITVVCVKAGSANQGTTCGPVDVVLTEPREIVTYAELESVCAGRAISHYSILAQETPCTGDCGGEPPCTDCGPQNESTTTTTTTTAPEEPEPEEDPSGVLGAGAANAQVGAPSFTG